jgi:hypothetical protein
MTIQNYDGVDAVNKIKFELDNLLDDDQRPCTQKPQHLNNAEARCLLELPSVEGFDPFNSQISTDATV